MQTRGIVYLVGAGPGDPGLLTLRGLERLQQADLVLYDGLVNPLLLRHTRGRTERTARTRIAGARVTQDEVNDRLISASKQGLTVVRLKGGDPFIFGRGGEEAAALAAAGIPYEVVPGITAATAASVCMGISLTHRDFASSVTFVTGHEDVAKSETRVDYAALARLHGTIVFYMGLDRVERIARELIACGKPSTTPAAVICRATLPTQTSVVGTLANLAELVRDAGLHAPSVIVVGDVVQNRQSAEWFSGRPLFGVSIGIARAEEQLEPVIQQVLAMGGDPAPMPLIEIQPPETWQAVDDVLSRLHDYDWLVFTSVNGVRSFLSRLWETGGDSRRLARTKLAVIGPATRDLLLEYGLRADLMPEEFRAEVLSAALAAHVRGKRVLWARANRGRAILPAGIRSAGGVIDEVVVYRNEDVATFSPETIRRIEEGRLHWIALSSPSIARGVARLFGTLDVGSKKPRLAAISPVTAEAAREVGLTVEAVATEFTWPGLLETIARAGR